MMNKKVSIIVPVHNGESYIKRCLKSLTNQTYKNIEVIIINNNSSDRTNEIVREFCEKDNRIIYYETEKSGVSLARNIGISKSTGNYIMFVDSDDYVENKCLEYIIPYLEEFDVVRFNYREIKQGSTNEILYYNNDTYDLKDNDVAFWKLFYTSFLFNNVWGQVINKKVITDILFNEDISMAEDYLFNYNLYRKCKKIKCLKNVLYNYTINSDGMNFNLNVNKIKVKIFDIIKVNEYIYTQESNNDLLLKNLYELLPHILKFIAFSKDSIHNKKIFLNQILDTDFLKKSLETSKTKKSIYGLLIFMLKKKKLSEFIYFSVLMYKPLYAIKRKFLR